MKRIFLIVLLFSCKAKVTTTANKTEPAALSTQQQITALSNRIAILETQLSTMDGRIFPYDSVTKIITLSKNLRIDTIYSPNGLHVISTK